MFSQLYRLRVWITHWLTLAGYFPATKHPPAWRTLFASLFFVPSATGKSLTERIEPYFPHINFHHLRLSDGLRFVLQGLWLLLLHPPARRHPPPMPVWMRRLGRWYVATRPLPTLARAGGGYYRRAMQWLGSLFPKLSDVAHLEPRVDAAVNHAMWQYRWVRYALYSFSALIATLCITTPTTLENQALFVGLLWLVAMWLRRMKGPSITFVLIVISLLMSTRYLWWRVNDTVSFAAPLDGVLSLVLLGAEIYAWLVLLLGYIQSSWVLQRKPAPLPTDTECWPTVDLLIPTYNEPLKVLMPTVYGAMGLDWPQDKLRIWVLDDGRRPAIREFCETAGVGYRIRPHNHHAKAGNINYALGELTGEFVAIFDCDHIPTRSFLQVTMGEFFQDDRLALVQTPHQFFSPDPFERNLDTLGSVPNEGELFYGRVQDGNDLWNATFFCGSCAVLRRTALDEVGGIAVETVTEDAHTSLKMHRRGWNSAYLNYPQAAGLATESLSAHVGQRIRWARGMAQIFRLDNPLLGKGLKLPQRLCYLNAMMHFLYGIPRLVFLTAPLSFLFFHAYVIDAPALAIVLYVLPHMAFAEITNARMQRAFRRSFWGEIYETVLAWYITRPTTVALFAPHKGTFNVTSKGGLNERTYFDWNISRPYLVLLSINLVGLMVGVARWFLGPVEEQGTVLMNIGWTAYNSLLLSVAVAVANEARQVRVSHRVPAIFPASVTLPDGCIIACETHDYSEEGASVQLPEGIKPPARGTPITVGLSSGEREYAFRALVGFSQGNRMSLRFDHLTPESLARLVQCTFGRADAWLDPDRHPPPASSLTGLMDILRFGIIGQRLLFSAIASQIEPHVTRRRALLRWFTSFIPRSPRPPTETRA